MREHVTKSNKHYLFKLVEVILGQAMVIIVAAFVLVSHTSANTTKSIIENHFTQYFDMSAFYGDTPFYSFYKKVSNPNQDSVAGLNNINGFRSDCITYVYDGSEDLETSINYLFKGDCIRVDIGLHILNLSTPVHIMRDNVLINGRNHTIKASQYMSSMIHVDAANVQIHNLTLDRAGYSNRGLVVGEINPLGTESVIISKTTFINATRLTVHYADGLEIRDNVFDDFGHFAPIEFLDLTSTPEPKHQNVVIQNNSFSGFDNEAIDFNGPAKNIFVFRNTFYAQTAPSSSQREEILDVGTGNGIIQKIAISQNRFECDQSGHTLAAIWIKQGTKDSLVESNGFYGDCSPGWSIAFKNSSYHDFEHLYGRGDIKLFDYDGVVISGNYFDGSQRAVLVDRNGLANGPIEDEHVIYNNDVSIGSPRLLVWRNRYH